MAAAGGDGRAQDVCHHRAGPLLAERGITLSASQVHRLVTSTPERLSLTILAALCDIFAVEAGELILTDAANVGVRKARPGTAPPRPRAADSCGRGGPGSDTDEVADSYSALLAAPRLSNAGLCCARCRRPLRIPSKKPPPPILGAGYGSRSGAGPRGGSAQAASRACETYGTCDGCGADRLLPGVGPAGQRWCTDCAGGIEDFSCNRCGQEGWPHYRACAADACSPSGSPTPSTTAPDASVPS